MARAWRRSQHRDRTRRHLQIDQVFDRGRRPADRGVSWDDAAAYAAFLAETTGQRYRLPSEAEWEYAARCRLTHGFWWGDDVRRGDDVMACCRGCGSEQDAKGFFSVKSMPANPWGLHNMHGNVWEWVADYYCEAYETGPSDGSARSEKNCPKPQGESDSMASPEGLRFSAAVLASMSRVRCALRCGSGTGRHSETRPSASAWRAIFRSKARSWGCPAPPRTTETWFFQGKAVSSVSRLNIQVTLLLNPKVIRSILREDCCCAIVCACSLCFIFKTVVVSHHVALPSAPVPAACCGTNDRRFLFAILRTLTADPASPCRRKSVCVHGVIFRTSEEDTAPEWGAPGWKVARVSERLDRASQDARARGPHRIRRCRCRYRRRSHAADVPRQTLRPTTSHSPILRLIFLPQQSRIHRGPLRSSIHRFPTSTC